MKGHLIAEQLAKTFVDRQANEADTRHQIINRLLHEVLGWPFESVSCEEKVHAGYIDFTLRDNAGRAVLLIEAKKEDKYFSLPTKSGANQGLRHIRLRTLATDSNIAAAVNQAAQYCPTIGCQYACVTNGHEFILFRSFIPGRHFLDADALVIPKLSFFSDCYTQAHNLLGFAAVTSERSLQQAFAHQKHLARDLFYPKSGITHYDATVPQNPYARFLDPIARRYFGEIAAVDKRMMDRCFVFARGVKQVEAGLKTRLTDDMTAFFKADGGQNIAEIRTGGKLAERIARSLKSQSAGEILILYGGKGAGKSTFLRRLLYHDPPTSFLLHGFPIIIDCLRAPQEKDRLTDFIWEQITTALDQDKLLGGSMEEVLQLFEDRFSIAQKQELSGYAIGSSTYLQERNRLVGVWKQDSNYVAKRLRDYWWKNGKRIVLAFDNTDQLPPAMQDHCFLVAQNIVRELECIGVISMREERYCRARTVGVLDAYQNAGFHLTAPELEGVFVRRIHLVIDDLEAKGKHALEVLPEDAPFSDLKKFFIVCLRQFRERNNSLKLFLEECSRDNTRLALTFFSQFISSGYTHVEEIIANTRWTVITHQVIKPMMIPQRFNYDENKSLIPNLFQCRTPSHGSHFTAIRILQMLRGGVSKSPDQSGFYRVDSIVDEFASKFGMRQDSESALDLMLRYGLIEANNRLDTYAVEKADSNGKDYIYADEVRITAFGVYMLDFLCQTFTYLDLVSLDCGLTEEKLYHSFCKAATKERGFGTNGDKRARLESRLDRTTAFVDYLLEEEAREKTEFLLAEGEGIVQSIKTAFDADKQRAQLSASRNISQ